METDVIDGGDGADVIVAGKGDDTIVSVADSGRYFNGGGGEDTLQITETQNLRNDEVQSIERLALVADRNVEVEVELSMNQLTDVDLSDVSLVGFDDADFFDINGDGADETINASGERDVIDGNGGRDVLNGRGGDDVINGGGGPDLIHGGGGEDDLKGARGDDVFIGSGGADRIEGGDGVDTVDYSGSDAGISIVLNNRNAEGDGGTAEGDRLSLIENAIASRFDDDIVGNDEANAISGRDGLDEIQGLGGKDNLKGGGGNDILDGGSGDDDLAGGAGDDLLIGGGGDDVFKFVGNIGDDVIADFQQGDQIDLGGFAGVETFSHLDIREAVREEDPSATDVVIQLDGGSITLEDMSFELNGLHVFIF